MSLNNISQSKSMSEPNVFSRVSPRVEPRVKLKWTCKQNESSTFPFTISWRVERQVNLQNTMKEVLSTNGSFTIINEARSTVLSGIVASRWKLLKLVSVGWRALRWQGLWQSKVFETSQVLAEGIEYSFWKSSSLGCAGRDRKNIE